MKNIDQALKFLDMGIGVIPISHRQKKPDGRRLIRTGDLETRTSRMGKEYIAGTWEHFKDHLPNRDKVVKWFDSDRPGLGIITGWRNLVVIDFDNMPVYRVWELFEKSANLPPTYKVKTNRGVHVYFFLDKSMDRTLKSPLGIDIKFTGYVLAPPSVHPSGHVYKVLSADNIKRVESLESVLPKRIFPVSEFCQSSGGAVVNGGRLGVWDAPPPPSDFKQSIKILSFFPNARKTGRDFYMDLCPFHKDRSPSFWINDEKNRCGCHTCIDGSMSSIDFYAKLNNLSFDEAIIEMGKL